jgi:hypothetical protein
MIIVHSRMSLWSLAFLHDPSVCIIGLFYVLTSVWTVIVGVPCLVLSPLSRSFYAGSLSFFPACPLVFHALSLFCVPGFRSGLFVYDGFFSAAVPPADLCDTSATIPFPLGISLLISRTLQSSTQSLIAQSNSFIDVVSKLHSFLIWIPAHLDPHIVSYSLEFGYPMVLRDHLRSYSSIIGYLFLHVT